MDADSSPLLAQLINHSDPPATGRYAFMDALQRLAITSVFDIIALSENEFAEQLAQYNDDDAHQIYRKALSAAAQLEALFREQQVSSASPSQRRRRATAPQNNATDAKYNRLFEENWQHYCASDSIAAIDSPVAYLRALYLFALQLERNARGETAIRLVKRRPDLKNLHIDKSSVSTPVPMLTIINQTLLEHIGAKDHSHACRVLSEARYPPSLPFHFPHHQCLLGLIEHNTALGALNYRISRALPVNAATASSYGQVAGPNDDVQCLLSGLSPAQQTVLTIGPVTQPAEFYREYYQWELPPDGKGPERISDFLHRTQIDAMQLQELLAQQTHQPRLSPNCQQDNGLTYGACYINGQANPVISLNSVHLLDVSLERFDRLQRMIRLQRWFNIPFAQLDTLVISAMRCEGAANPALRLNHNTLRALGVYRFLNQHYGLHAEEFAALLHQLPVHATEGRVPLFDQVFNPIGSALPPLKLDAGDFDALTRQQLCAGLSLQDTEDSLQRLIRNHPSPVRTLAIVSTLYRRARIARLFGLSVMACEELLLLLGKTAYHRQLLNPTLRQRAQDPVDLLDLLMHLEWASRWLRGHGGNLALLRHQLLLEPIGHDPVVARLTHTFLSHPKPPLSDLLSGLELPQQSDSEQSQWPAIEWTSIVNHAIQLCRTGRPMEIALDHALTRLKLSVHPDRAASVIDSAKQALRSLLHSLSADLRRLHSELINIVNIAADSAPALKKYDHPEYLFRLYVPLLARTASAQAIAHLLLLLPNAADFLRLPVSQVALHQFLINPHWLSDTYNLNSLLELNLHTLYLMQQFKHCTTLYNVTEEQLLDYFKYASDDAATEHHIRLAHLLGWSATQIQVLSRWYSPPRITCVDRLEWVLRCRQACTDTGLSADLLLQTCQLHNRSPFEHWQAVGNAMTGTPQRSTSVVSPDLLKD
ncbi:Tc toxin subunit A [Pseudomonas poae]|nr:Tc toxin subunit A [Pseudomonas poae]